MEKPQITHHATAYELLVASEEKGRTALESLVYLLLIGATITSIWQAAHQPVNFTRFGNVSPITQQSAPLKS